jgi:hypothetical protein
MDRARPRSRLLVAHAREEAFVPRTRSILSNLGYRILTPEELEALHPEEDPPLPDLRIVDERRMGEIPDEEPEASVPVIVLTGRYGVTGADARVVGAIMRPAGLHDLYVLAQQVLEDTPRSTLRVATHLRAACRHLDKRWTGAVLSLSRSGCLLRSPEPLPLGAQLQLSFELPRVGAVELQAETAYQLLPDLGLVFHSIPPEKRDAIASYVSESLATM